MKMLPHRPGKSLTQAVVESFVIRIVEALLLERPFQVPINFSQETEVRCLLANSMNGHRPERLRLDAPGALEDLRQHEHRHVAAYSITLAGDFHKLSGHGLLSGGIA